MTTKYRIRLSDLERTGGVARADRDGFTKQEVMKAVHQEMRGASRNEKEQVVERFYRRNEPC